MSIVYLIKVRFSVTDFVIQSKYGIFPPVASHSTFLLLATASSGPGWTEGPHDQGSGLRGTGYYQEDGVQCHDMLRHDQALCKTPRGPNVVVFYWNIGRDCVKAWQA